MANMDQVGTKSGISGSALTARSSFDTAPDRGHTANVGDALVTIARDSLHAHMDTIVEILDTFIPRSLPNIIRHEKMNRTSRAPLSRTGAFRDHPVARRAHRVLSSLFSGAETVQEKSDSFAVDFEVPGWSNGELSIRVGNSAITVTGEKRDAGTGRLLSYDGAWHAPEDLDADGAKATMKDGLLRIEVPKLALKGAREIKAT